MDTVVSADGTTIAFDRIGAGPPLILVGGAFQYRSFDPRTGHLAGLLGAKFTTYHYDRRGRGDSGDTQPYAPEREIEDLASLIEAAGGSAYLFGMSSGAALALDAVAHGLAVTRLATYEAPFMVDDSRPPVPGDYPARLDTLLSAGRRGDAVALFLTECVGVPAEVVSGMRTAPMWAGFEAVAHTIPYDDAFLADVRAGQPLPAKRWLDVTVPTLVIDGGASLPWVHHGADALADVLPDARRTTLDGQDHAVEPESIAPVLTSFYNG